MKSINFLQTVIHYKAQYLAALNNSFLPWKPDDSQSNLIWNTKNKSLVSRPVGDGSTLEFSYFNFVFIYHGQGFSAELNLANKKHDEIIAWIKTQLKRDQLQESNFGMNFTYSMPIFHAEIEKWDANHTRLVRLLADWRSMSQINLEKMAAFYSQHSEIRVWPHHFDTGMLIDCGNAYEDGVGLGYAMKDNLSQTPYYYVYAWSKKTLDLSNLPKLNQGHWHINDWKGAILPVHSQLSSSQVLDFYTQATNAFVDIF